MGFVFRLVSQGGAAAALLFDPLLGSLGTHFTDAALEIFMERNVAIRRPFLQLETSDQAVYREINRRRRGSIYAVGYFSFGFSQFAKGFYAVRLQVFRTDRAPICKDRLFKLTHREKHPKNKTRLSDRHKKSRAKK